jgi:hypothetical protein
MCLANLFLPSSHRWLNDWLSTLRSNWLLVSTAITSSWCRPWFMSNAYWKPLFDVLNLHLLILSILCEPLLLLVVKHDLAIEVDLLLPTERTCENLHCVIRSVDLEPPYVLLLSACRNEWIEIDSAYLLIVFPTSLISKYCGTKFEDFWLLLYIFNL